jgi:hypothetical protein
MKYSSLNHNFQIALVSRSVEGRPFHIKEPLLCCKKFQPQLYGIGGMTHPGYKEILIDLKKTDQQEILIGGIYEGGYWSFGVYLDDIVYCKQCYKNLWEYIKEELGVPQREKIKVFKTNLQQINWLHKYETEKHP